MDVITTPDGVTAEVRSLSATELQSLLKGPLKRAGGGPLPAFELEILAAMMPTGPHGMTNRPDKQMEALLTLIPMISKVKDYWIGKMDFANKKGASDVAGSILFNQVADLEDLQRLAIRCQDHFDTASRFFEDEPKAATIASYTVWMRAVNSSGANRRSGLSEGGPGMAFIMDALILLGWRPSSEAAVLKSLRRHLSEKRQGDKFH